ncbi:hypothetical protein NDU88_009933, partial [Pleurodeles waltl]
FASRQGMAVTCLHTVENLSSIVKLSHVIRHKLLTLLLVSGFRLRSSGGHFTVQLWIVYNSGSQPI